MEICEELGKLLCKNLHKPPQKFQQGKCIVQYEQTHPLKNTVGFFGFGGHKVCMRTKEEIVGCDKKENVGCVHSKQISSHR